MGRVDHQRVRFPALIGQLQEHSGKDTFLAPSLPTAVTRLWRAVFRRRVSPPQAIAIDEDNPAQDPSIIDPRLPMGLGKERGKLGHLLVGQSVKVDHVTAPFCEQ
jgi:hypothetical protein